MSLLDRHTRLRKDLPQGLALRTDKRLEPDIQYAKNLRPVGLLHTRMQIEEDIDASDM
jgi:hypothetical protein